MSKEHDFDSNIDNCEEDAAPDSGSDFESIRGSYEEDSNRSPKFNSKINPGSTMIMKLADNCSDEEDVQQFQRLYMCFAGVKEGFLVASYVATEGETKDSWIWFMNLLKEDLKIERDYEWTMMSDKQKGLYPAHFVLKMKVLLEIDEDVAKQQYDKPASKASNQQCNDDNGNMV
ncbi:hypothetical protein ACH5RR_008137 [Cinchona calisaya]|uniref:MULE transposase domain-containing protein n=1 Tax=Cinchona calisaya TaxID=153742 RepID=A0ABD3AAH7_9GENT